MVRFSYYAVEDWTLDNWGEYLIAGHKAGDMYYYDPTGGSQYFAVINNAPIVNEGYFVAMPERQIICYGSTFNGIQDPLLVRWCDIGNFTSWVGTVTNQAGSFRIPKGSRIVGGMQGPQQEPPARPRTLRHILLSPSPLPCPVRVLTRIRRPKRPSARLKPRSWAIPRLPAPNPRRPWLRSARPGPWPPVARRWPLAFSRRAPRNLSSRPTSANRKPTRPSSPGAMRVPSRRS